MRIRVLYNRKYDRWEYRLGDIGWYLTRDKWKYEQERNQGSSGTGS